MDLMYDAKAGVWKEAHKVEIFFDTKEQRDKFENDLNSGYLVSARKVGKWIPDNGDAHRAGKMFLCSCCGRAAFVPHRKYLAATASHFFEPPGFCPNPACGAKMDSEVIV